MTRASAAALIRAGTPVEASSGRRHLLSLSQWGELADRLDSDPLPVATLWSDGAFVHALLPEAGQPPLIASVAVEAKRYLALSPARPGIAWCERSIRDLWGIEAIGARDLRPWLDHGAWGRTAPLAERPGPAVWSPEPPEFEQSPIEAAAGMAQLGVGPVNPLDGMPAHLRLTLDGNRIARLELLLGYSHRGVLGAMRGRAPAEAAPLAGRIDAATTVAHQAAFARAVEAACGWRVPPAAEALRRAMAELEHSVLHLHHLAGTVEAAGLDPGPMAALRETILRACRRAFGHRMMLDTIVPGGVARAPGPAALARLLETLEQAMAALPAMLRGPGVAGRLAGRAVLAEAVALRCLSGDQARLLAGDVAVRCRMRLGAIGRAVDAARGLLAAHAPDAGLVAKAPGNPVAPVEGIGMAEAAHGPVWHWLRLEDGRIAALHVHDPAVPLWLALEQAAVGLPQGELALLSTSLGVSASGADL